MEGSKLGQKSSLSSLLAFYDYSNEDCKKFYIEKLFKIRLTFTYFSSCTNDGTTNGQPWCAYEIQRDGNAVPGKWEDCDPSGQFTAGKNIIATIKIRNNYAAIHSFFQYCDSNIGLFSIAPCKFIILNTFCILFGISSLLFFIADSDSCRS